MTTVIETIYSIRKKEYRQTDRNKTFQLYITYHYPYTVVQIGYV